MTRWFASSASPEDGRGLTPASHRAGGATHMFAETEGNVEKCRWHGRWSSLANRLRSTCRKWRPSAYCHRWTSTADTGFTLLRKLPLAFCERALNYVHGLKARGALGCAGRHLPP